MELSNLINNNSNNTTSGVVPFNSYTPPQHLQHQQQQQQQQTKMFPIQLQQQQQQQKQHIKLPSIHEIINISELNYQIAHNNNNNNNNKQQQYYTPPLNSNYNYNNRQPQQPQPHTIITSLVNESTTSSQNLNDINSRSSPIQSVIHSPIESPIFQRCLSTSSSSSTSDHSDFVSNTSTTSTTTTAALGKLHQSNGGSGTGIISRSQNGRKGRSNLPKKTTMILVEWLYKNINHPYPNPKQKTELIHQTGLSSQQLSNWFINARRRKIRSLKFQEDEKYIL